MPRGRNWFGPGFWKGSEWVPGAGGFRGGRYGNAPGSGCGGPPPCRWWFASPGPYYTPPTPTPEEEKAFLQEQTELLKDELAELENRLSELEEY